MRTRWPAILAIILALAVVGFLLIRSGHKRIRTPVHLERAAKVVVRDDTEVHDGHFTTTVSLERRGASFAYHGSTNGRAERTGTVRADVVEAFLSAAASSDAGSVTDKRIAVTISDIPDEPGTVVLTKLDPDLVEPYADMMNAMGVFEWIDEARRVNPSITPFVPPDLNPH